jgi:hypothetical protein
MTVDGAPVNGKEAIPDNRSSDTKALLADEKRGVPHADVEVNDVDEITDLDMPQLPSWLGRHRGLMHHVKLCAFAALILSW